MRRPRRILAIVAALALAVPSAALAQSAGDDQYTDPFSEPGGNGSAQDGSGSGQGSSGSQSGDGESSAPAVQGQTSEPDTGSAEAAQTGTLPQTGGPTPLLLAYGWVLLVAGTALRRLARRPS